MYCGKCDQVLPDDATFCGRCGTPVLRHDAQIPPEQNPSRPDACAPDVQQYSQSSAYQQNPQSPPPQNSYTQNAPQRASATSARTLNRSGVVRGMTGDKFGCLTAVMYVTVMFLCGGGAGIAFKNNLPLVGIPMIILGVVLLGVWLIMWIVRVKSS